jgi:hypothetical protein
MGEVPRVDGELVGVDRQRGPARHAPPRQLHLRIEARIVGPRVEDPVHGGVPPADPLVVGEDLRLDADGSDVASRAEHLQAVEDGHEVGDEAADVVVVARGRELHLVGTDGGDHLHGRRHGPGEDVAGIGAPDGGGSGRGCGAGVVGHDGRVRP